MEDVVFGIIGVVFCVLVGGFCVFCSVMNFDWFFSNRKAVPLVKLFGRNGTRIFYICLGAFIMLMALIGGIGLFFV